MNIGFALLYSALSNKFTGFSGLVLKLIEIMWLESVC